MPTTSRLASEKVRAEWLLTELLRAESAASLRTIAMRRLRDLRADVALSAGRPTTSTAATRQLLIVDSVFPDPTRDSGSDRIARIARMSASLGYRTVIATTMYRHWAVIDDTSIDDIVLPEPHSPWTPSMFWEWVGRSNAIWLERPDVAGRVLPILSAARGGRRVIYSTTDLHHVRIRREADLSGRRGDRRLATAYHRLERDLLRSADLTVAITPDEQATLEAMDPSARVELMPNVHAARRDEVPARAGRRGLVFVGNYKHGPNVDAVRQLVGEIMPRLWESLPDAELTVIGDRLPSDISEVDDSRIHCLGWVEDLAPHLDGSVALAAPLRFGSGMKGKIGRAMANGLPVVTTRIGAEGMELEHDSNALIADSTDSFARQCHRILTDDELWSRLSASGIERIESTWSADALLPSLRAMLETEG